MAFTFDTGSVVSGTLTGGLRPFYDQMLLDTLRNNSVYVPYVETKVDFAAKAAGQMVFSEVYDTEPYWNAISETSYFLSGMQMGSRSVTLNVALYGDVMKFSDFTEYVNFFNNGDFRGLVQGKLGQNMVETLDILAMNAFNSAPFVTYAGGHTNRFQITSTDIFDPDLGGLAFTHLQERLIPGLVNISDGGEPAVIGITSPRVIHDIRTGTPTVQTKWIDILKYQHAEMKMKNEVGAWDGVRYVKSTRARHRNAGKVIFQSTLTSNTIPQQGGAASVFGVYTTSADAVAPRTVPVVSSSGFAVGQYVTIHSQTVNDADGSGAFAPNKDDGTQETRLIISIGSNVLSFDKPLLKAHLAGDYVTNGVDLNYSNIIGGPAVALGVAEMPTIVMPPKMDDLQMLNRIGWRMFGKFQMFRPEWTELIISGGSST